MYDTTSYHSYIIFLKAYTLMYIYIYIDTCIVGLIHGCDIDV